MKRVAGLMLVVFFSCLAPAAIAAKKEADLAERQLEIERTLFLASANQNRVLRISLVDCVLYALKGNSEILVTRIDPRLRQEDIRIEEAAFAPTFNTDASLFDNTRQSTSSLTGGRLSKTRDGFLTPSLTGKLLTGTGYTAEFINQRSSSNSAIQTINPYYAAEPKITVTQPLFRDFGVYVNRASIAIARNNKLQSEKSFRDKVMDVVTRTKSAYYNYIFNLDSHAIAELSLQRVKDLLEINRARYNKGLLSSVDLLETESAVAEREKALLSSESSVKLAEDQLKLITNLVDDPELWNAGIELIDRPEFKLQAPDLLQSLKNAFSYRPDYQSARIDLANRDILIKVAENQTLPTVDLVASFGLNGLGAEYSEALKNIGTEHKDWSIGLKFSVPFGGADQARKEQRNLEKAQALINFKRLEQDIMLDVRERFRQVQIQGRQAEVARLAKELEAQNYEAQEERYAAGQASTHDILDYQDRLAQAELDHIKALIDYNIALINLDQSEGLTLAKNDINLEE